MYVQFVAENSFRFLDTVPDPIRRNLDIDKQRLLIIIYQKDLDEFSDTSIKSRFPSVMIAIGY